MGKWGGTIVAHGETPRLLECSGPFQEVSGLGSLGGLRTGRVYRCYVLVDGWTKRITAYQFSIMATLLRSAARLLYGLAVSGGPTTSA